MRRSGFYELLRHRPEFVYGLPCTNGDAFELVLAGHHNLKLTEGEIRPSMREA